MSLEQVHAAILYYLHNRKDVNAYMAAWLEHGQRMREEQQRNPPPHVAHLRALLAERREVKKAA